uniref:Uncharacterized protein n=1 Tax=Arundo donax TaxID=35708 RepID=A0A0A9AXX6_ARUDO
MRCSASGSVLAMLWGAGTLECIPVYSWIFLIVSHLDRNSSFYPRLGRDSYAFGENVGTLWQISRVVAMWFR